MNIESYEPRRELEWRPNLPDGSGRARIECDLGVVDFFTFAGEEDHPAFTQMKIWIHPRRYHVTLPRHYQPRWWRRLAREFAWEASRQNDKHANGGAA